MIDEPVDTAQLKAKLRKHVGELLDERVHWMGRSRKYMRLKAHVIALGVIVGLTVAGVVLAFVISDEKGDLTMASYVIGVSVAILLVYALAFYILRSIAKSTLRLVDDQIEEISSLEHTLDYQGAGLKSILEMNVSFLSKYYKQTRDQARGSYVLCVVVASVSMIVILVSALDMLGLSLVSGLFVTDTQPITDTQPNGGSGGSAPPSGEVSAIHIVALVAGLIGEFIASIFFAFYNRTITSMGLYHQKLLLSQNVGIAVGLVTGEGTTGADRKAVADSLVLEVNKYIASPSEWNSPWSAPTVGNGRTSDDQTAEDETLRHGNGPNT